MKILAAASGIPGLGLAQDAPPRDPLFGLTSADAVLAALVPPTSMSKLASGNDLLLEVADVVRSGEVTVHAVSYMPRTRALWLLTLSPDAQADDRPGPALLAKFDFAAGQAPSVDAKVSLSSTQTLLLVAQAGGRYYGVRREVKVGTDVRGTRFLR